jgi:8-oxo-dGTP diphosphatase
LRGDPPGEVLLGYKKRGFGQGKYGGFGGKVENGESLEVAVLRETEEETGVHLSLQDLDYAGRLVFLFPSRLEWSQEVHVYRAQTWQGEPVESEEMIPEWYTFKNIPYSQMWDDSPYWLPPILAGRRIQGRFIFSADNEVVREAEVIEIEEDSKAQE